MTIPGSIVGSIKGSRGMKMVPDKSLDNINTDNLDLIVFPGGQPGTDNLIKDHKITRNEG